jgi:hypothetical protein
MVNSRLMSSPTAGFTPFLATTVPVQSGGGTGYDDISTTELFDTATPADDANWQLNWSISVWQNPAPNVPDDT